MDDPEIADGLEDMEQLETLRFPWEHLHRAVVEGTADIWHLLPSSLQGITITWIWRGILPDLTTQIHALAAREEGLIPNLKEVRIAHSGTHHMIKEDEDEGDVARLMEACN